MADGAGKAATGTHWDAFLDWILATAGPPEAAALDRYRCWYDGAPPPATLDDDDRAATW